MLKQKEKDKEKEQAEKIKALRRELEDKIEEQLPPEMLMDEKTRVEVQRINENEALEPARAKQVIEALLFAASKPMTVSEIRRVMKFMQPREIEGLIQEISEDCEQTGRSFQVVQIAGGYEMATKKEFAPWILKVELQKKAKQVTQSALETLAILAYKQPITRAEIEDLRGVDVSGVMTTLAERGLIKIVGKKEVPGRPFVYGTTEKFLEHFGLKALTDLPSIDEIKTLVERSVRKDELLGTTKMVDMPQDGAAENPGSEIATDEMAVESTEAAAQHEEGNESESTASQN